MKKAHTVIIVPAHLALFRVSCLRPTVSLVRHMSKRALRVESSLRLPCPRGLPLSCASQACEPRDATGTGLTCDPWRPRRHMHVMLPPGRSVGPKGILRGTIFSAQDTSSRTQMCTHDKREALGVLSTTRRASYYIPATKRKSISNFDLRSSLRRSHLHCLDTSMSYTTSLCSRLFGSLLLSPNLTSVFANITRYPPCTKITCSSVPPKRVAWLFGQALRPGDFEEPRPQKECRFRRLLQRLDGRPPRCSRQAVRSC